MFILHVAIGGCLKAPPVEYGVTADTGGHIAYVIGAAQAQAEAGAEVSILTRAIEADHLSTIYGEASEEFGNGVRIIRLRTPNRRYLEKDQLAAELLDLTFAFTGYLHALARRPDIIHAHFADAAEMAFVARDAFGIPVVYTPHALGRASSRVSIGGAALPSRVSREHRALEEADAVVVSSRDEATLQVGEHVTRTSPPRLYRIPPGVPDHGMRPPQPTEPTLRLDDMLADPDKPIVLAIARPVWKKNLSGLVRAFRDSRRLRQAANLVILAGQAQKAFRGEQASVLAELHDLIDRGDLRGEVAMPADHARADVATLYRRAAAHGLFANVAFHEPFGLTLLEAAAHGVPVVATRAGGARDIVGDIGHGLLVDPTDEAAIAGACLRILDDRALRSSLSSNGLRHVGLYDWARYARRSLELFAAIISRDVEALAGRSFPAQERDVPCQVRSMGSGLA